MRELAVDEYLVKVQGTSPMPLEGPLELGQDVSLRLDGTVTKELSEDNDDGTRNVTYIVKGILARDETPPAADEYAVPAAADDSP